MVAPRYYCIVILFWMVVGVSVQSYPYFFLDNLEPKCVSIAASHETTLIIQYDVPDLVTADSTEETIRRAKEELQKQTDLNHHSRHGMDSHYQRRMQERLERQANMAGAHEMFLTIQLQGIDINNPGTFDYYSGMWKQAEEPAAPVRHLLSATKGIITYPTENRNGAVEVCVKSNQASITSPERVSLNITERSTYEYEEETKRKQELSLEKRKLLDEQHRLAEDHMYQISFDLKGLEYKLQFVLNHADHKQHQDESFRLKSLQLNRQVLIWPKVKLAILLVTSIWQAHHIVGFFKRHYI